MPWWSTSTTLLSLVVLMLSITCRFLIFSWSKLWPRNLHFYIEILRESVDLLYGRYMSVQCEGDVVV